MSGERFESEAIQMLRCPVCVKGGAGLLVQKYGALECRICARCYRLFENMADMMPQQNASNSESKEVEEFWGKSFNVRFNDMKAEDDFIALLEDFRNGLIDKEHLLVNELNLEDLKGRHVLEIGSGAGAHAALMKSYGPFIFAMDIASERVRSTAGNLSRVSQGDGIAIKGDAEQLPFKDDAFDVVYSSGVLHHAPDTDKCIREVYRVLKPGGKAVIMLYARWAASTFLYIYGKGIKSGVIFRYPEARWMGYVTEGGPISGTPNPYTRVYSRKQLKKLFADFREVRIRQSSFRFFDMPLVGKYIYGLESKLHKLKKFEGGKLASGIAWKQFSPTEKRLGKYLGNCMNILAIK